MIKIIPESCTIERAENGYILRYWLETVGSGGGKMIHVISEDLSFLLARVMAEIGKPIMKDLTNQKHETGGTPEGQ